MIRNVPEPVMVVLQRLNSAGHPSYLVGGCVRDSLLGRTPKDYDIATAALPDEVRNLFERVIPTGEKYGTMTVLEGNIPIEVTTFRTDGNYSDGRRPDNVTFGKNIVEDLARRDFTMNAMAWSPVCGIVDPHRGVVDLSNYLIKAVGNPDERFNEDALRMLRAIRFASVYAFDIDVLTKMEIAHNAPLVKNVAAERIREELNRILLSDLPSVGIHLLRITNLLYFILPELEVCHGFDQRNPHHRKDVFDHILAVLNKVPPVLHLRLAALLHDVAKPVCFAVGEDGIGHFYEHEDRGAEMARAILERLRYDRDTIRKVTLLVREHMLAAGMGPKAIRRLIVRVGADNVPDLLALAEADIKGSRPPHDFSDIARIRTVLEEMQEAHITNPASDLAVSGRDVMTVLGLSSGPQVGKALRALRELVLDNPEMNNREALLAHLKEETPNG